jgi:hypothetical protein
VTDNAQSVFELSQMKAAKTSRDIKNQYGFDPDFENASTARGRGTGGQHLQGTAKRCLSAPQSSAHHMVFGLIILLENSSGASSPN